jgi:hypothetical protein
MTKTIDYSKTIIYKLVCNDLNITDVYVGHTTNFLKRRTAHKNKCNNEKDKLYNLKVYQMIRQNGGWVNWSMVEIEKFPCSDKNEAVKKERYYYELLNSTLNTNSPIQTKEDIKERAKIYYNNNKERAKIYYNNNKDVNNERDKIYYNNNKDDIREKRKIYHSKYRDDISKRKKIYYNNNKESYKIRYLRRKIKKLVLSLFYLVKKDIVILNGIK